MKKEETQLIMDLLPAIGTAIQNLQGTKCNEHLQSVNILKMAPTLLQYGPITTMNTFLAFYQTYHSLDDIPNPTIRTMEDKYIQPLRNAQKPCISTQPHFKEVKIHVKCLESILTIPTTSYIKQVEENK